MNIPWGFVVSKALQDIRNEPFIFISIVLCATMVFSFGPFVMGSKKLAACLLPPWANRAVVMIAWKSKVSENDRKKVIEVVKKTPWCDSIKEVSGEEVAKEIEMLAKNFGKEFFLTDPSTIPGYLELTFNEQCIKESQKCQAFVDNLASDSAVDSVYSGIALASETRLWFEMIRRLILGITVFFLVVMFTMVFLLIRVSFYRRMREIYLWDLLGASPVFKRLACYIQAVSVIILAWPISLIPLYYIKRYWQHLEGFFGINQGCWLSDRVMLGFSIATFILVTCSVLAVAEWAFRKSWNTSVGMDWTWTD